MKRLKKAFIILCICYVAAYILAAGVNNFRIKNEYEKQKLLRYEQLYYKKEGVYQNDQD